MIRIENGIPIEVPDDEWITLEMKDLRDHLNTFLRSLSEDSPKNRAIRRQFLDGRIGDLKDFGQWYLDHQEPSK